MTCVARADDVGASWNNFFQEQPHERSTSALEGHAGRAGWMRMGGRRTKKRRIVIVMT